MMFCRFYHVSSTLFNFKKQAVKLNKLLNPSSKKKWKQSYFDSLPTTQSLTKTKYEHSKRATRRVAVLNKLFMKNVTDLMSSSPFAAKVIGNGIEVSKVKISPDFQQLNVYWICKGTSADEVTEAILKSVAGPLRHGLSTLKLMGEIPHIDFIKDEQESVMYDIDRRLAMADFGEDYEPTEIGHILKSEFSLHTKLSPEMKMKIRQLDADIPEEDCAMPEMTHTVYGLEHDKIINRLMAARKRSQAAWESVNDGTVVSYRAGPEKRETVDHASQRKVLAEFLQKRQILKNKILKEIRSLRDQKEVLYQEPSYDKNDYYDNNYDDLEDDYSEEDDVFLDNNKSDFERNK